MSPSASPMRLLILGGTLEARKLASHLSRDERFAITSSLAGRTEAPTTICGDVRIGGFGGSVGLVRYVQREQIATIVDATHPFATTISSRARDAAIATGCSYLRLCRPPWRPGPDDSWTEADDVANAATLLTAGTTTLLTIGHQQLAPFAQRTDVTIYARMIERPETILPAHIAIIQERPPFSLEHEIALMRDLGIQCLVTKNAGGDSVAAKLDAARHIGIPVIMIRRPDGQPPADATSVRKMIALLEHHVT